MDKADEEITIYFQERTDSAFTPFYYDPATCRGVIGQRKNISPVRVVMSKEFNADLKKYPHIYRPIKVQRRSFEELHKAAEEGDSVLVQKIIEEKFK